MKRHSRVGLLAIGIIAGAAIVLVRAIPRDGSLGRSSADAAPTVRPAAVAGTFYPLPAETLRADVRRYLDEAAAAPSSAELTALIVPHAGYEFSGPVAGHAYRALEGRQRWATPLGEMEVDRAACDAIAKACRFARISDGAHGPEHSIEVQLPFLQAALGSPKLVPVLMVDFSPETCESLARALADWARRASPELWAARGVAPSEAC